MTKKEMQTLENEQAMLIWSIAQEEIEKWLPSAYWHKLRSCSAEWCLCGDYAVLRSYSTIVAVLNRETGVLVDMLRYVYGYTATSASHIAKFAHDCHAVRKLTYKEV